MTEIDSLNVEELIRQAKEVRARWHRPIVDEPKLTHRNWQQVLDNKDYPKFQLGKP